MSRGQRLSDSNTTNDPAATDDKFARHIEGCVHVIPQLKALLPSLPALIAEDALLQSVQVQQLVAQQQWFMVSSTVIRDALSLLKLGSKWDELASGSVLHRYGNVLHLVGRAWRGVAVQLAGTADSSGQVRKQTIRSGEHSLHTCHVKRKHMNSTVQVTCINWLGSLPWRLSCKHVWQHATATGATSC